MRSKTAISILVLACAAAGGCPKDVVPDRDAYHPRQDRIPVRGVAGGDEDYVTDPSGRTRPKDVVVQIRVQYPQHLRETFALVSMEAAKRNNAALAEMFATFARGSGSGSGFVLVRRVGASPDEVEELVVTNRHVVDFAQNATIVLPGGATFEGCEILYIDPVDDLAVLAFPEGQRPFRHGLRPAARPVEDLDTVIAVGFPAALDAPSYQISKGEVSNASFSVQDDSGVKHRFIQHTAAIGPGSSGGPLLTPAGDLIGVNTFLAAGRNQMFFAIPAARVSRAIDATLDVLDNRDSAPWKTKKLREACRDFTTELASVQPDMREMVSAFSQRFRATHGIEISAAILKVIEQAASGQMRVEGLQELMGAAIGYVIAQHLVMAGYGQQAGAALAESCDSINRHDEANITRTNAVRIPIDLRNGRIELIWTFEQGRWRIADIK